MKMSNLRYKAPSKKNNPAANSSYRTSDLHLSAFLKSKGIILQGTEKKYEKNPDKKTK